MGPGLHGGEHTTKGIVSEFFWFFFSKFLAPFIYKYIYTGEGYPPSARARVRVCACARSKNRASLSACTYMGSRRLYIQAAAHVLVIIM